VKSLTVPLLSSQTALDGGNPEGIGTINCPEQSASHLLCFGVDMGMCTTTLYSFLYIITKYFFIM
jgi:hypothetical protein